MPNRYGEGEDDNVINMPDREWAAHGRLMAVVNCGMCDDNGYRGTRVCDHQDHAPAAKRGMAAIREILKRKAKP